MAERQTAPTLAGIRADHVGRYQFACNQLGRAGQTVLDIACGCGYGSHMLAEAGFRVRGVDLSEKAIEDALKYWSHPRVQYSCANALHIVCLRDWIVCFETLEHIEADGLFLRNLGKIAPRMLLSVPNQERLPFNAAQFPYHIRHYTPGELDCLLRDVGWQPIAWFSQPSRTEATVQAGTDGYTLIVECRRA